MCSGVIGGGGVGVGVIRDVCGFLGDLFGSLGVGRQVVGASV